MNNFILGFLATISSLGYFGIVLALSIEIIPSELVLGFAGFMVSQGKMSFLGAILSGLVGVMIAQLILYYIGYFGGRPVVLKYGKFLHIRENHLTLAEKWFLKYGSFVTFTARFVPVIRQVISIPAGLSKMSVKKFSIYTAVASVIWCILFVKLGEQVGSNWSQIKEIAKPYTTPILVIALLLFVVYFVIHYKKRKKA